MRIGRGVLSEATRRAVSRVWLPFVLSRVWVGVFVLWGHCHHPYLTADAHGYEGVDSWWLNPWTAYDSRYFLDIARHGYEPLTAPFFPLYPFLLKLAGPNEVMMALWGVALSNVALFAGLVALHRLTTLDHDEPTATRAVWLLAFWPTTAVFSAVYTESVFLLLLVTTFLAARQNRWAMAGICGLLASLTRNPGPLIFAALLLEWLHTQRQDKETRRHGDKRTTNSDVSLHLPVSLSPLLLCFLPLLGFVLVQGWMAHTFGGLNTVVAAQAAYGRAPMWPWTPIIQDTGNVLTLQRYDLVALLNIVVSIGAFFLAWAQWKRGRASYALLIAGIMLMHLTLGWINVPHTNSALRYMSTTFPFVQILAVYAAPLAHNRFRMVLAALGYALCCALISYYFGFKYFVGG